MTTVAEVRLWGRTIGAVSLADDTNIAAFEYDPAFAGSGIEISPITMPLGGKVFTFPELSRQTFHGLPGLLADALPDRFGNRLNLVIRQDAAAFPIEWDLLELGDHRPAFPGQCICRRPGAAGPLRRARDRSRAAAGSVMRTAPACIIGLAVLIFLFTSVMIGLFILRFVNQPIKKLIHETRRIAKGDYFHTIDAEESYEMDQLAEAITDMAQQIASKQDELNKQKDRFRQLFEQVPCAITVQDRNYRLIEYNQEFEDTFAPKPGDFCYYAYKGRTEKCENCPVEKTFADGEIHSSEETVITRDGREYLVVGRGLPLEDLKASVMTGFDDAWPPRERRGPRRSGRTVTGRKFPAGRLKKKTPPTAPHAGGRR